MESLDKSSAHSPELPHPEIPKFDPEKWRNMLDILHGEPGIEIVESGLPLPKEEELDSGDFSEFKNLSPICQKSLRRLARACRVYLVSFIMIDHRPKQERDDWETDMQRNRYPQDFNIVYDWSKMRANTMSKILNPLTFLADTIEKRRDQSSITPGERVLLALDKKLPPNLVPPHQELVYDAELDAEVVQYASPYGSLTDEQKREVVAKMDDICREFLALIEAPPLDMREAKQGEEDMRHEHTDA